MIYRLPPLNALRVFEAAARHLSFKEAANELSITQAAVSHQIKSLEEYLGVELFRRAGRGVQLTEAARACLPKLREGFESLAAAVETIRERATCSCTTTPWTSWPTAAPGRNGSRPRESPTASTAAAGRIFPRTSCRSRRRRRSWVLRSPSSPWSTTTSSLGGCARRSTWN